MTTRDLPAPTPGAGRLTAAHELLLLARGTRTTAPRHRVIDRAIAGGLLGELAVRGLLRPAPAAIQLSPVALDALPHLRDASPTLALVLEQLLATREPCTLAEWVTLLALRGSELRQRLLAELRGAGVLDAAPGESAAVRLKPDQPLALRDATPLRLVRERLRAVALHGVQAAARDRLQLSLLSASGLEGAVFTPEEWRRLRARIAEITRDEPIGEAVRRPRAHTDRQGGVPPERFCNLLAWLGLPAVLVDQLAFFWRG